MGVWFELVDNCDQGKILIRFDTFRCYECTDMEKCAHKKGTLKDCALPKMCHNITVTRESSHQTIVNRECAKPKHTVKLPSSKHSKCEKTIKKRITTTSCFCNADHCN